MANEELTLRLYNNSSSPNVVYKKKTLIETLTGQLKENVDMENVVVTIPYTANYASINYAHIPEFKRFYNAKVEVMNGGRLKLTMKSDPLSSFWENFKTSQCIARRSSSNYNPYLPDNLVVFKPQPIFIRRKTASKFTPSSNAGSYILTIGGK